MLKEIRCNKFNEKVMTFGEGLNVVLGDDKATNSIGKSTILMIIDFVYGGDTYLKSNYDAIENLEHHEFEFKFIFDEELYFKRSTNEPELVSICNKDYTEKGKIKKAEYTALLKKKYKISIESISFRDIVGRYARIWGKENLDIGKPLQYVHSEPAKKSIIALIKLFDKYRTIATYERLVDELTEEKKILQGAVKKNLIPKMTAAMFKSNEKTIGNLNKDLDSLKQNIRKLSVDVEALLSKEIFELKSIKSQLVKRKNIYDSRLIRTRNNINNKALNINSELVKLTHFFPHVNIERINEIDSFHNSLAVILKDELKNVEKDIVNQIKVIETEMDEVNGQINANLSIKDVPKYELEKLIELSINLQKLNNENIIYNKGQLIADNLSETRDNLNSVKIDILADISNQVNIRMHELNKLVYTDNRRAPALDLKENNYIFKTFGDTGTGTAYANLITFDIAVLDLTELPVIVHDLPLFKNVENEAMQNIIKIYNQHKKQIFIAIDEMHKYTKETVKLLKDNSFVQLSKDKTLFTLNWKNEK